MSITSIRALRILMPLSAFISLFAQLISIFTNQWLYTVELMPNDQYEKFRMPPEMEFNQKHTTSGLWLLCYNDPPDMLMKCMDIDYFTEEEYVPDQNDSTMAIPYTAKTAAIYFLISTITLVIGHLFYFLSKCCGFRRIIMFISGIPFILSGLMILSGIVVYVSTFKGEVGHKLRTTSEFQDPMFSYRYGYSFLLLLPALIFSELTGTLAIFLYVSQEHFKIMIDAERDEVLKNNILDILIGDHRPKRTIPESPTNPVSPVNPVFRISCDDDDDEEPGNKSPVNPHSSVNHNFLSPEFGLEPALYFCGRHGSRGRRNSRSTDSHLGSPGEPAIRRASSTFAEDEPKKVEVHELHVPSEPQSARTMEQLRPKASTSSGRFSVIDQELTMPFAISMCIQRREALQQHKADHGDPNKSTLV